MILKEVYHEPRPNTLSQFWYDRRNGPQWYTFWVALWVLVLTIVTIVLAVVQCVEGGLQVYLALRAWGPGGRSVAEISGTELAGERKWDC